VNYFEGYKPSAWSEPVLLYEVIFLAWQSVVYVVLAIQLDKWSTNPRMVSYWRKFTGLFTCRCFFGSGNNNDSAETAALLDDDDVLAEQERVLQGKANSDLIAVSQLTKIYDNGKMAVNNLSFGIPPGQTFGLLGINGYVTF
jgi:ATP-binding cassette subfamily A (ABC1) protein 3